MQAPQGPEHLVRVEPTRWWSSGERGGSIGPKTITNGRPYIAFINPGFVSTDFTLVPLESAVFEVTTSDSNLEYRVRGLSFAPFRGHFAVCPAELATPKRTDCLYSDHVNFQVSSADLSTSAFPNGDKTTFFALTQRLGRSEQRKPTISVTGLAGPEGGQLWAAHEARRAAKRQAAAEQAAREAEQARRRAQIALEESRAQAAAFENFLRTAPRAAALICDSGDQVLAEGGSLSRLSFNCKLPGGRQSAASLEQMLSAGWFIESQTLIPTSNMYGRPASTVNLVLRKGG